MKAYDIQYIMFSENRKSNHRFKILLIFSRFDWFIRLDDDAYVETENVLKLLIRLNTSKPVFMGHVGFGLHNEDFLAKEDSFCMVKSKNEDFFLLPCLQSEKQFYFTCSFKTDNSYSKLLFP